MTNYEQLASMCKTALQLLAARNDGLPFETADSRWVCALATLDWMADIPERLSHWAAVFHKRWESLMHLRR